MLLDEAKDGEDIIGDCLASPVIPLVDPNDLIDLINFYWTKTISLVDAILSLDVSGERWDETGMSAVQNARRNETCLQLTSRQGSRGERSKECNAEHETLEYHFERKIEFGELTWSPPYFYQNGELECLCTQILLSNDGERWTSLEFCDEE